MTAYTRNMTQEATYWPPGPNDGFGGQMMGTPVLITCRWQDQAILFRDADGREVTSSAVVYVDRDLAEASFVFLSESIGDTLLTCVRATPPLAYYKEDDLSLAAFAPNVSRYGDEGLLVEPQAINMLTGNIAQAIWATQTISKGAAVVAPGGIAGITLTEDFTNFRHLCEHGLVVTANGVTYTMSMLMKAGDRTMSCFTMGGAAQIGAYFDLQSGHVMYTKNVFGVSALSADIQPFIDGWWLGSMTFTVSGGGNSFFAVLTTDRTTDTGTYLFGTCPQFLGEGKSILVAAAQLEVGSTPSSPIVGDIPQIVRDADAISFVAPTGTTSIVFTFDDGSTQTVAAAPGDYTIPTNLNRRYIENITTLGTQGSVGNRGYLALGDRTAIPDPRSLSDAYEIRSLQKSPHLSGNPILHKALL